LLLSPPVTRSKLTHLVSLITLIPVTVGKKFGKVYSIRSQIRLIGTPIVERLYEYLVNLERSPSDASYIEL